MPLSFVFNKNITYHHFKEKQHGSERVWISQPRNGFDQQCKLQVRLRAESPNWGSFLGGKRKSAPIKRWPGTRMYIFNIFNAWAETTSSIQWVFLSTAGYFRNKNVLKHEAEMLEKIRTF